MLSESAKNITKDVDNVRKNTDIESLLQKYHEKPQRDFIQKYAETKIASVGSRVTNLAYLLTLLTAIVSIMLSVSLFFYPEGFKNLSHYLGLEFGYTLYYLSS